MAEESDCEEKIGAKRQIAGGDGGGLENIDWKKQTGKQTGKNRLEKMGLSDR